MSIQFYEPISQKLKPFVEGYYFRSKSDIESLNYLTFPNNYNILTFLKGANFSQTELEVTIYNDPKSNNLSLTYDYIRPMRIQYLNAVEELTIYFKPFGLNQFIPQIHSYYTTSGIHIFEENHFLYHDLSNLMNDIEDHRFVEQLDYYLESVFVPQSDFLLEKMLTYLTDDYTISELSEKLGYSRQYISRYFRHKIGKSPNSFRKIQRFRVAIHPANTKSILTDLGNSVGFFDQSHFIKDFKNITSKSPKDFFKAVSLEKKNIWLQI